MPRRLPPLTAIRAFEAAARHCSFTLAANELHVTQTAISHQVKQLETWLAMKLFERRGHALTLTAAGTIYLADLSKVLDSLADATARLTKPAYNGPLRVTVLPSFASKWLLPRLSRFHEAYPGIDLHISTSTQLHDFTSGGMDLGIRLGLGRWPGLRADLIAHESFSPLCSPRLLNGAHPLREPPDLRFHVLLHDQPRDLWSRWLDMAAASQAEARDGPVFNDSALVLQAAIDGQGVTLGRLFLAADDIAAGRLCKPFAHNLPNDFSYWLVYPKATAEQLRLAAFRNWLLDEAKSALTLAG